MSRVVVAGGTVTVRRTPGQDAQILLVHRPSYDDWSLPKGKLVPDEYAAVAAARETYEETGVRVRLRDPISVIRYPVGSGTKVVHYWLAAPHTIERRRPDKEVDKVVWLTPRAALARLTYPDEKDVVVRALAMDRTTPFLIVRHGKAMDRKNWSARDQARPLTSRGRKQSRALVPLLESFGVERLASSSSTRCMQTLAPYAKRLGSDVQGWAVLSEEIGGQNPAQVAALVRRLARDAAASGVPAAVCGHRPILPTMLDALGVPVRPMQTAASIIAHLDPTGHPVAVEFHRPTA